MAVTLDASTPAAVYSDVGDSLSLTTASFTPPLNSVIIVKVTSADAAQTHTSVTGVTFTSRGSVGTSGATSRGSLWTAIGAGSAVTVTAAFGGTAFPRGLVVEVYTGAQLAASPAVSNIVGGSGAPTNTLTTVAANSVVSWVNADWQAIDGTSRTYRSSATETAYHRLVGQWTHYTARQAAASAGSQTYGLTAPIGQTYTMVAIEIQDSGSVLARPQPRRFVGQAVNRGASF